MAYTPSLKKTELYRVVKTRRLPIKGDVLVKEGDKVAATTVVAKTNVPGDRQLVNVSYDLGRTGIDVKPYMHKNVGDIVEAGEVIASRRYKRFLFFGLTEKICCAPIQGIIEYIFGDGRVVFAEPTPVELNAYIPGAVTKVLPKEGAVIETLGGYIQGIFGIGGETYGELMVVAESPEDILTAEKIRAECAEKILVGGALVEGKALQKAVEVGVKGIVTGGIDDRDLIDFLGYDVGVGITGQEEVGLTVIITEGFGKVRMAEKTFKILKRFEGKFASINGTTQIRAGVIRPEIIIPRIEVGSDELAKVREEIKAPIERLKPGTPIKIIREPNFGVLGRVVSLPVERQEITTESKVRVLEVELADGRQVIIPRANVEFIEA